MADEIILLKIEVDNDKAQKDIEEQTKLITQLKKANKDLSKEGKKDTEQYAKNQAEIQKLNSARRQNIKLVSSEKGSLNELRANLAKLTTQRNATNASTKEGSDEFKRLTSEIKKQNDSIKEAEQAGGDFRRNVGNYGSALDGLKGSFAGVTGQSEGFGSALGGLGNVFKASPIGILVTVLAGLVAAFSKTEKGAKFFAIAGEVVNSVFSELVGLIGTLANGLIDLFSDPVANLKKFGEGIKTYIIDQFKLVIDGLGLLGESISLLFAGEFTKAAETAGQGLKKIYVDTNPLVQVTKVLTEKTIELTGEIVDNTKKTIENASARFDLERSILSTQKTIAKQIKEEERLNKIADDATLSLNKQKKANEDYEVALNKRLGTELTLLEQQEKILQSDVDRLKNAKIGGQELLDARQILTDKQIEISQKETEQQQAVYDQQQRDRQINQDQWEQDLDFIIDIGLRRAEQLKKQSEDESLSLFERTQALKQYTEAIKGVQEGIINSFEESGLSEKEFNRLLGIRDPEQLAEEIRKLEELSEVENNRLKEGLQEFIIAEQEKTEAQRSFSEARIKQVDKEVKEETKRRSKLADYTISVASNIFRAVGSFLKQGSAEQKAFAIADATINTYAGVTKALKETTDFTPTQSLRFANAAAVGITGFAQVAKIASTSPSGGGGGGGASITTPSSGAGSSTPQISTNAIDQQLQQQEALIAATNNIGMSISVTEINDVQQSVNISEQIATI